MATMEQSGAVTPYLSDDIGSASFQDHGEIVHTDNKHFSDPHIMLYEYIAWILMIIHVLGMAIQHILGYPPFRGARKDDHASR